MTTKRTTPKLYRVRDRIFPDRIRKFDTEAAALAFARKSLGHYFQVDADGNPDPAISEEACRAIRNISEAISWNAWLDATSENPARVAA